MIGEDRADKTEISPQTEIAQNRTMSKSPCEKLTEHGQRDHEDLSPWEKSLLWVTQRELKKW